MGTNHREERRILTEIKCVPLFSLYSRDSRVASRLVPKSPGVQSFNIAFSFSSIQLFFTNLVNRLPPRAFIYTEARNVSISNAGIMRLVSKPKEEADGAERAPHILAESAEIADLSALFRTYSNTIFRIAFRITGSHNDAEDVLQTIFLRLTPSRRELSPNPEGYFKRAALNAALDIVRKRSRTEFVDIEEVDANGADTKSRSPEDQLTDTELRQLIRHAVAKLEGRAAAAFALRYFEGCDNAAIAKILGTSQMVVAVTLHRARTRLRKEIGTYLEKHHDA